MVRVENLFDTLAVGVGNCVRGGLGDGEGLGSGFLPLGSLGGRGRDRG